MSLPGLNEPYPFRDQLVVMSGEDAGKPTQEFDTWLTQRIIPSVDAAPSQFAVINTPDLNDAVALTEILPEASAGLYRFNYYLQIITADGASSAAQVALTYVYNGQPLTQTFTNINGNTVTTFSTDAPFVFRADGDQPITYAITYSSGTANAMHYSFTGSLELLKALSS